MKRIIFAALIVLLLLFLLPSERSLGRQEPTPVPDLTSLKWQVLSTNAVKTDLGGNLPEVAILRLTNDQFTKIYPDAKAAKDYFDSQKIFKRALIKVIFCDVTPSKGTADWLLIVPHTTHSTASVTAWQLPAKDAVS